jgi:hypothetical protein
MDVYDLFPGEVLTVRGNREYVVRSLERTDFHKGYLGVLGQLTKVKERREKRKEKKEKKLKSFSLSSVGGREREAVSGTISCDARCQQGVWNLLLHCGGGGENENDCGMRDLGGGAKVYPRRGLVWAY